MLEQNRKFSEVKQPNKQLQEYLQRTVFLKGPPPPFLLFIKSLMNLQEPLTHYRFGHDFLMDHKIPVAQ